MKYIHVSTTCREVVDIHGSPAVFHEFQNSVSEATKKCSMTPGSKGSSMAQNIQFKREDETDNWDPSAWPIPISILDFLPCVP